MVPGLPGLPNHGIAGAIFSSSIDQKLVWSIRGELSQVWGDDVEG